MPATTFTAPPLGEADWIEQQRTSAIEELQTYIARKMDISIRMELLVPANWYWDDATGASVQFSVDGHSFVLAQQKDGCHLFLEADGSKIPLAVLPDQDRQQFTDHLLVEIGDALVNMEAALTAAAPAAFRVS